MLKGVFINWGKGDRFIENGVGVGGCSHGELNKQYLTPTVGIKKITFTHD